ADLIFANASRQPSTSPSATRLPSTLTTSSSRPVMQRRPFLSSLPRSPVRSQPPLSVEPIATMPDARSFDGFSSSYGPIDLGESVLLLTQIKPALSLAAALPSGPVIFT